MNSSGSSGVKSISLSFEGREIRCQPGVSIAAALTGAGELELRETATGESRGLFCGMGVCQECRVIVDGQRSVRACMTPAREGLQILREKGPVSTTADGDFSVNCGHVEILTPEILVIGAGPGGLVAASVAAEAGAEVVVLDERPIGGGQYYKQPSSIDHVPESLSEDRQFSDGKILIERAMRSGARVLLGNQVWGAFVPNEFAVFDGEQSSIYKPKRTIVASGAHERGLPIPGWTLPGVMTTGAAQSMLRNYGTLPGQRILIAGNGPLNLQVALELFQAGAEVFAVAELAKKPTPIIMKKMGTRISGRFSENGIAIPIRKKTNPIRICKVPLEALRICLAFNTAALDATGIPGPALTVSFPSNLCITYLLVKLL